MHIRVLRKIRTRFFMPLILNASFGSVLSAQTVDDLPLSPRLAALQDRLKSGDQDTLDSFWKEIGERGAPMTEPAEGSDRDMLVTMLWRAKAGPEVRA